MNVDGGPLVSIITPSYNEEEYIKETVESIKDQYYDNIEHIIIDGGSTDKTLEIVKDYENSYNLKWISRADDGMYEAIEHGFEIANGEIYSWLNANDRYYPWSVDVAVAYLMHEETQWITGIPTQMDEVGRLIHVRWLMPHYRKRWIEAGYYHGRGLGWIQQPSTFWTRSLWETAGGFPEEVRYAGDFYLWRQFASEAQLVTVDTILSSHRKHSGQISCNMAQYNNEIDTINYFFPSLLGKLRIGKVYSFLSNLITRNYSVSFK